MIFRKSKKITEKSKVNLTGTGRWYLGNPKKSQRNPKSISMGQVDIIIIVSEKSKKCHKNPKNSPRNLYETGSWCLFVDKYKYKVSMGQVDSLLFILIMILIIIIIIIMTRSNQRGWWWDRSTPSSSSQSSSSSSKCAFPWFGWSLQQWSDPTNGERARLRDKGWEKAWGRQRKQRFVIKLIKMVIVIKLVKLINMIVDRWWTKSW